MDKQKTSVLLRNKEIVILHQTSTNIILEIQDLENGIFMITSKLANNVNDITETNTIEVTDYSTKQEDKTKEIDIEKYEMR